MTLKDRHLTLKDPDIMFTVACLLLGLWLFMKVVQLRNFVPWNNKNWYIEGGAVVLWLAVAAQQEATEFDSETGRFCVKFACSPCVWWVLSGFLPQSKNMQSECRLIGDSKLPVGMNVSVDSYLSLYVSPAMNWWLVQGDASFVQRCWKNLSFQ